jgi:GNAT superfamily N-acetyltransferase
MPIYQITLDSFFPEKVLLADLPLSLPLKTALSSLHTICFKHSNLVYYQPGKIYLLIQNEIIVSTVAVSFKQNYYHMIYNVCTHPQYRGRGLMKNMLKRIVEENRGSFYLQVEKENWNAYCLYWKLGFTPIFNTENIITMLLK